MNPHSNKHIILIVVITVCALAGVGVITEAVCAIYKIPDMSGNLSSSFTHVVDTLVGALLTLLVSTRAQSARKDEPEGPAGTSADPLSAVITNKPSDPVPVDTQKP